MGTRVHCFSPSTEFLQISVFDVLLIVSWALLPEHRMALDLTHVHYFLLPFPLFSGSDRVHTSQWAWSPLFNRAFWLRDINLAAAVIPGIHLSLLWPVMNIIWLCLPAALLVTSALSVQMTDIRNLRGKLFHIFSNMYKYIYIYKLLYYHI